jgi:AraC family transcriptional regulator
MGISFDAAPEAVTIEAELHLPIAKVELIQIDLAAPIENVLRVDDAYRIDLSLTPRLPGTRFSFSDRWSSHRFVAAGRVFVLPPNEPLRVRSGVGRQGALILHLYTELIREWFEFEIEWTDRRLEASLDVASLAVRGLLIQLAEEVRCPGFASEIMSEALAMQIAVNLYRYYIDFGERKSLGGLAPWRLRLIDERFTDMDTAPSLSELAEICKLSARQLSRGFRASKGISIGEYVVQRRLENAKKLLVAGGSVKSVAYSMGFASPSSFCYAFRKSTGIAPGQFRRYVGSV